MAHLKTGDVVAGRYRVERLLGVGGMGTVFAARDGDTPRMVAIKVLNEVLRQHPTIPKRFLQEAKAASLLATPHAVKVEATGDLADGTPFIVMEYLDGVDLATIVRGGGGRLPVERVLCLADQIAAALQDAHARGVLHRDLKPENVFVIPSPSGEFVKVVDFGISKILAPGSAVKITVTGTTVGTPQYMPMEQLRGVKDLDGRVDVYALGILLYEMLAGARPYDGFSYEQVIMKVATTTAAPLSSIRQDLPPGLSELVARAMARERGQRLQSMEQLRLEMRPFWSGRSPAPLRSEPPQHSPVPAPYASQGPMSPGAVPAPLYPQPLPSSNRSEPPPTGAPGSAISSSVSPTSAPQPAAVAFGSSYDRIPAPQSAPPVGHSSHGRIPAPPIAPTVEGNALGSHAALPLVQIHVSAPRPRKKSFPTVAIVLFAVGFAAVGAAILGALATLWYLHEFDSPPAPAVSSLPDLPRPPPKRK